MGLYPGSNTWANNITTVEDGDPREALTVNVGLEGLANRTVWLRENTGVLDRENVWTELQQFVAGIRAERIGYDGVFYLPDVASQVIVPGGGATRMPPITAAPSRIVSFETTNTDLIDGERITIFCPLQGVNGNDVWRFRNEGSSNNIFTIDESILTGPDAAVAFTFCTVQFVDAFNVWVPIMANGAIKPGTDWV